MTNQELTRGTAVERMEELHERMEQLGAKHRLSRADAVEWDELKDEFDQLHAHVDKLDRLGDIAKASAGASGFTTERGSIDGQQYVQGQGDYEQVHQQIDGGPLDAFAGLLRNRKSGRVELRSATTANAGARTAVAAQAGRAMYLHQRSGVQSLPAAGSTIESPYFAKLVAQSATAEGGTKPEQSDPTLKSSALGAYAVTQTVTDQLIRFGVGLGVIGRRLESEVVYSINAAFANAAEAEAGAAVTFDTSAAFMVDSGIADIGAKTGNHPTAVLLNSADYPVLSEKAGADSGDDIGSRVIAWNGVPLFVNDAITAGVAVIVDGMGWSAYQTALMLDSMPKLETNEVLARAEQYFVAVPHYAGSAVAVDLAA